MAIGSYIGSSAGACAAAACIFFKTLEEAKYVIGLERSNKKLNVPRFTRRTIFQPNMNWLRGEKYSGFFSANGIEKYLRKMAFINDFKELGPEVFLCATQLNGSRKVIFGPLDSAVNGQYNRFIAYYNDVSVSEAVAASACVPGLFQPFGIENKKSGEVFEYIDGEARETLSVHIARDTNVDLVIISNVWMPYHFDRQYGSISKRGIWSIISQALTQIIEQKVDRFRNEYDRYRILNQELRAFGRKEGLEEDLVERLIQKAAEILKYRYMEEIYITPDRCDSKFTLAPSWSFNKDLLRFAFDTGYNRAVDAIDKWVEKHKLKNL